MTTPGHARDVKRGPGIREDGCGLDARVPARVRRWLADLRQDRRRDKTADIVEDSDNSSGHPHKFGQAGMGVI